MEVLRRLEPEKSSESDAGIHRDEAWFLRTPEWRYIWWRKVDRDALYRIAQDPFEEHDVSGENPELATAFRQEILAWIAESVEPYGPSPDARQRSNDRRVKFLRKMEIQQQRRAERQDPPARAGGKH